jgi:2,4-dienoyl-CoA reductase-like NADH-dependent reductase (Old Yellow Enzyme family)
MKLFEPFRIGPLTLENRIVLPAMVTRLAGEDGAVNDEIRARYVRFAKGRPGLIVIEAMSVHGGKSGPLLRLSSDEFVPGQADLVRRMRDVSSSKVAAQIIHFLKISRSGWRQKVADLSRDEIRTIVVRYAEAGERARRCGYDAVELHMAHAYTVSSFLSALNQRPDEYGRSLENRMRLATEIVLAVRAAVGAEFPVGVRFDGEECIKNGYTLSDSRWIARRMAELGSGWISISAGGKFEDAIHKPGEPLYPYTGYSGDRCMPPASYPDGANLYLSEGIKAFLADAGLDTPVVATGKIRTPEQAEAVLQSGKADLIGMARALLADPDWAAKVGSGRGDHLIRCVYGNVCKNLDENFQKVVCTLWPKGSLQAPESSDTSIPAWPTDGSLRAEDSAGRVHLRWEQATDGEAVYGYEIYRSEANQGYDHLTSVKGTSYVDRGVVGGVPYRYFVRAYDLAGNRSPRSGEGSITLPSAACSTPPTAPVGPGGDATGGRIAT